VEIIIKVAEALDAVVNVQLLPMETVRLEEKPDDTESKKPEPSKGIRYTGTNVVMQDGQQIH
jgi:hypothetical protein